MIEHMSQSGSPQYFRRLFFNSARLMSCFGSLGFHVKEVEHGGKSICIIMPGGMKHKKQMTKKTTKVETTWTHQLDSHMTGVESEIISPTSVTLWINQSPDHPKLPMSGILGGNNLWWRCLEAPLKHTDFVPPTGFANRIAIAYIKYISLSMWGVAFRYN